ncbi:MAG: hypothetical protein ACYCVH_12180 [Ignavibacteriaceae bacterium]
MEKLYKLIPLLFALLLGCESPNEPVRNVEEFFPLKVGNKWYYNSTNSDTTSIDDIWEITGQKEIDNKKYYEIIKHYLKYNLKDTLYYRLNGDTLFSKGINYNEQIVADFSLNINEIAYWKDDLKVVQKTENIITFETPFGADYGYSITFKRGIGIASAIENGFVYYRIKLIKAEIK